MIPKVSSYDAPSAAQGLRDSIHRPVDRPVDTKGPLGAKAPPEISNQVMFAVEFHSS
jgi:hypothetical protein